MMTSDMFKGLLTLFLSGLMPVTIASFLLVRRTKKKAEFARVVEMLAIAADEAEFARDRVSEQYASSNYRLPVLFAWLMSILGFYALLFGADLVGEHPGKANFLLTGVFSGSVEQMQALRLQGMTVMTLAFLGAYLWSSQAILRRLNAGDLTPSVYFSAGIRMMLAPALALMVSHVTETGDVAVVRNTLPVAAFLVGFFPDEALQFLKERVRLFADTRRAAHALPLSMIEGINVYHRARLAEVGVDDAQNLACANFIELVVRTSFNPIQIIDWIAQARLYTYFKDDIVALRQAQVRSMFDLLPATRDPAALQDIADAAGLPASRLRHYCTLLGSDLTVQQLRSFQERLCTLPRRDDGAPPPPDADAAPPAEPAA